LLLRIVVQISLVDFLIHRLIMHILYLL